jgi:GMP synthase (glutamine-hydrolysing)
MDALAVLDFGSQYAQLIARRVRELHVYSELFPWDAPAERVLALQPKGFIRLDLRPTGAPNTRICA